MVPVSDGWVTLKTKSKPVMNKSTRLIVTAAAMAGLYAGSMATRAYADGGSGDSSKDASKDAGKHDCKGQNSCKGTGGCKAGDNGCKGQNSCKGKGGCNTNKSDDQPSKAIFA
jgi:hypothetical protein